jgi:ADP-dependent phosphofructokinase/glucokinase
VREESQQKGERKGGDDVTIKETFQRSPEELEKSRKRQQVQLHVDFSLIL